MIFLLVLLFLGVVYTEGKTGKSRKPPPTPAPTVAPVDRKGTQKEVVQFTFENETIKFLNVATITEDDVDSLFAIQKEWFENYFREQQGRRWMQQQQQRGLQDRRRDSRDITTDFEFVAQNVTNSTDDDGKPNNEVTYNQVIGFGPTTSTRRLVEINIDDIDEVYRVSTSIYQDMDALDTLATELRENVTSFSELESIVKPIGPPLEYFLMQVLPEYKVLRQLFNGDVISLARDGVYLSIEAVPRRFDNVGSIVFTLESRDGGVFPPRNDPPFTLGGTKVLVGTDGEIEYLPVFQLAWTGQKRLFTTTYSEDRGRGNELLTEVLSFEVVE